MTAPIETICPVCDMEYDWPGVRKGDDIYCCEACARGEPCTCLQHQHGYERGELLSPEEVEQVGVIPGPME